MPVLFDANLTGRPGTGTAQSTSISTQVTTNQLSGYTLSTGYTYDVENRLSLNNTSYNQVAITFAPGTVRSYFGGRLVGQQSGVNTYQPVIQDRLGSVGKYYPYGEERNSPQLPNDEVKFATAVKHWDYLEIVGMSHHTTCRLLTALFLCTTPSLADGPLDCVNEIAVPRVNGNVIVSIPATVQVHVRIGEKGIARAVEYEGAKPLLRIALDQFFKRESSYLPACAGRTITFVVRYTVEGAPTSEPLSAARFKPPNEFIVVAHPVKPSLDAFPQIKPK